MVNPFPDIISDRVWSLLFAWAEWRSTRGCPKSVRFPDVTYKWHLEKCGLVGEPGFCMERSTAPKNPGILEEFGQVFEDLEEWARRFLFDLVEFSDQPLLRGRKWRMKFKEWGMSRRMYARLQKDALSKLQRKAKYRGLTRWSP